MSTKAPATAPAIMPPRRHGRADKGEVVRHQPQGVTDDRQDRPVVSQDDPPADRANEEAREERGDAEEEEQVLPAAALECDRVGERIADQEAEDRREAAEDDRVREVLRELRNAARVVLKVPHLGWCREPRPKRALGEAEEQHLDVRDHEEQEEPEQAWRHEQVWDRAAAPEERHARQASSVGGLPRPGCPGRGSIRGGWYAPSRSAARSGHPV